MNIETITKYDSLIKHIAAKCLAQIPSTIIDENDLYMEACLVLDKMLSKYNKNYGKVENYLWTALSNHFRKILIENSSVTRITKEAFKLINSYISSQDSLETFAQKHGSSPNYLRKILFIVQPQELQMSTKDNSQDMELDIVNILNNGENKLLNLHREGYNYREIGQKYGKSEEWARLEVIKILNKIKDYLAE